MTRRIRTLLGGTAITLSFGAQPALADVTPGQVWEGLRYYLETTGYTVTASRDDVGDDVLIEGLTATIEMPDNGGSVVFEAGNVRFEDQGDGTVLVLFPQRMPITFTTKAPDQPEVILSVDYTHTGLTIVVSGDEADMAYELAADTLGMALNEVTIGGEPMPEEMADGAFSLAGLTGSMTMGYGDLMLITQAFAADQLTYNVDFTDPDSGDTGSLSGTLTDFNLDGDGALAEMTPDMPAGALLEAGMRVRANMSYATGQSQFVGTSDGAPVEGQTSSANGSLRFNMSEAGLSYDIGAENVDTSATLPDLPFPVSASMDKVQVAFDVPVMASETPQDFGMVLQLAGLEISEMIWMMFDPTEILPRDPATLIIDVAGQATTSMSILDPEAIAAAEGPPGALNAVNINTLNLSLAGAELSGAGAFTFDNDDLETFDGMPAPTGAATLSLVGANGLIDKLIEMGLLTNEDAMGARMMISMFSVPGDGEDTLSSTITVTEDGQVLANGQRIR